MLGNLDLIWLALAGITAIVMTRACLIVKTWRQRLFVGTFGFLATAIAGLNAVRDTDPQLSALNQYVWIALGALAAFGILFELYNALRVAWHSGKQNDL